MSAPAVPAIPRRVWVVAAAVAVGAFMTQLDAALVSIGLASIANDLHAALGTTQWIVSGYLLGLVVGLPLCGWLSARIGAGRLWALALVAFTLVSVLCAGSPTIELLIASRVLQGVAGGLLLPAGQTVIAQIAGRAAMGRVMSVVGTPLVLGPALGPTLGGWIVATASWPWLFLINVPVGVAGLWIGARVMDRGERDRSLRFDGGGFVLVGVGLPALTLVVGVLGEGAGFGSVAVLLPLVVGVVALAAFVRRSLRVPAALLDLRLFARHAFRAATTTSFFVGATQLAALVVWALYFQLVRGDGLVATGLMLIGYAAGSALLPIAGRLTDRYGGGPVALAGTLLTSAVLVGFVVAPASAPLPLLEAALVLAGIGNALSVVPASTAAYVTLERAQMPGAVTQMNILLRLGGAVGSALGVTLVGDQGAPREVLLGGFDAAFAALLGFSLVSVVTAAALARRGRPTAEGAAPAVPVAPSRTEAAS